MPELSSAVLRRIQEYELARGNPIRTEETGWSAMDLVIRFAQPLDAAFALSAACGDPAARFFETGDPHYGREFGLVVGREGIVGPKES